jgi:predicted ATP-binding protein involved in virulence
LYQKYPKSPNALKEPAIVLIDELDLHLHPKWQRGLRESVVETFPNIQFIATAHSPILAQSYLGMNLAVVREEQGQAVIESDPEVARTWRIDEVVTSALYELDSAFSPEIARKLKLRTELLRKPHLSPHETRRLASLNQLVEELAPKAAPEDERAMSLIRHAADLISTR